jgi:phosphoglycolate phosphatase
MLPPEYDYWVFDLDGTLVDVHPEYVHDVMGRVGARLDHEFSGPEAERVWHSLTGDPNASLRRYGLEPSTFWQVFHEVEQPERRAAATFLHQDATLVEELDRPVALVTHCQRYLTEAVLDRLEIRDWFDTVICCTDETGWKPDPAPVELALSRLDGAAEGNGVLVGDGPQDMAAAWNAGLNAAHVERHGHDRRGLCVLGDHRVDSFEELWHGGPAGD